MDSFVVLQWMQEQMRQGLLPSKATGQDVRMAAAQALARNAAGNLMDRQQLLMEQLDLQEPTPLGCSPDAIKLFIGNIPKSYTEKQLLPLFETVGKVIELAIIRDKQTHMSKGCAFLWYQSRHEAQAAIAHFNKRHVLPDPLAEQDQPLVVRRANRNQRVQTHNPLPQDNMHPLASADRAAHEQQALLSMLQAAAGAKQQVGAQPMAGLPTQLHNPSDALQGMLLSQHGLNKQRLTPDLAQRHMLGKTEAHDMPPAGCAPDAIKLFVGNIPKCYTEGELLPLFESAGKVIQLAITRDKQRNESKGSAFVWYQNRVEAEAAIIRFNMRHVLWDPTGAQDRPLEVRRAYSHQPGLPGNRRQQPLPTQRIPGRHGHDQLDEAFLQLNGLGGGLNGLNGHDNRLNHLNLGNNLGAGLGNGLANGLGTNLAGNLNKPKTGSPNMDMLGVLQQCLGLDPQQQAMLAQAAAAQQDHDNNAMLGGGNAKPSPELQAARMQALLAIAQQKMQNPSPELQAARAQAYLATGQKQAGGQLDAALAGAHRPTQELQAARLQALMAAAGKGGVDLEAPQQNALLAGAHRPTNELQAARIQAMFAAAGQQPAAELEAAQQAAMLAGRTAGSGELEGRLQALLSGRQTPPPAPGSDGSSTDLDAQLSGGLSQGMPQELHAAQIQALFAGRRTPPSQPVADNAVPGLRAAQLQALLMGLHKLNPDLQLPQHSVPNVSELELEQSDSLGAAQSVGTVGSDGAQDHGYGHEDDGEVSPKELEAVQAALMAEELEEAGGQAGDMQPLSSDDGGNMADALAMVNGMEEVPEYFKCPITRNVMTDPVKAADGYTYERQAITDWLQAHDESPITRLPMGSKHLVPNPSMCLPSQALPLIMLLSRAKAAHPAQQPLNSTTLLNYAEESADGQYSQSQYSQGHSGSSSGSEHAEDSYNDWLGRAELQQAS